jgi:PXPV repeat (3 copies)
MNRIQSKVAATLLLAIGLGAASAAQAAGNVSFFVGIDPGVRYSQPVYVQPEPVYVQPRPVYVEPQTSYYYQPQQYVQPAPVYVRPAPVFYSWEARREWERAEWRRRHGHGHGHGYGHDGRGYDYGYGRN